eukprot:870422-Rhodomonas_salina.1
MIRQRGLIGDPSVSGPPLQEGCEKKRNRPFPGQRESFLVNSSAIGSAMYEDSGIGGTNMESLRLHLRLEISKIIPG